ncbi:MAG: flagellar hook assembly protein FlgD [Bryobacteraceae bacterium]
MATSVNAIGGTSESQTDSGVKVGGQTVGKDDFLQLLVAQIKNQNPLNPADGVEFLSQLAQFSQLEQLINIRTQLENLAAKQDSAAGTQTDSGQQSSQAAA